MMRRLLLYVLLMLVPSSAMFRHIYDNTCCVAKHCNSPLPWTRKFVRDVGPQHRHGAATAADRVQVGSDLGNAAVFDEIEMDTPSYPDAIDEFCENVEEGMRRKPRRSTSRMATAA